MPVPALPFPDPADPARIVRPATTPVIFAWLMNHLEFCRSTTAGSTDGCCVMKHGVEVSPQTVPSIPDVELKTVMRAVARKVRSANTSAQTTDGFLIERSCCRSFVAVQKTVTKRLLNFVSAILVRVQRRAASVRGGQDPPICATRFLSCRVQQKHRKSLTFPSTMPSLQALCNVRVDGAHLAIQSCQLVSCSYSTRQIVPRTGARKTRSHLVTRTQDIFLSAATRTGGDTQQGRQKRMSCCELHVV